MHEWALAEAVISTILKIAGEERLKDIAEVNIKIGELQQIDQEIFEFALSQLQSPLLKNAKFNFETIKAELKCKVCGRQWSFDAENLEEDVSEAIHFIPEIAHTYIKCPKCSSPDFEILVGRGVWLESIKGVK
ncbi:MAG: hydrogenase nickel incorporation protein HypA [Candidatus Bathyarchaeota archaeon]|nr:hydrogenase nickel incorporation protein HypA [Candidatus Bathyarchaeota archaeon]MDH5495391.1 hydrogenase nickel incorporation protein HypA [Candidatus Bathyarchaeota archaeon]